MPKLPAVKPDEVVRALERAGFVRVRQTGSHRRLVRGNRRVTVAMHTYDMPPKTLRSAIRQAGLSVEEFLELLKG